MDALNIQWHFNTLASYPKVECFCQQTSLAEKDVVIFSSGVVAVNTSLSVSLSDNVYRNKQILSHHLSRKKQATSNTHISIFSFTLCSNAFNKIEK